MDGIWLDMNEPSNFCNGACDKETNSSRSQSVSVSVNYVSPPYSIDNRGNKSPLNTKTLDMDAMHDHGPEYDVHNLYGNDDKGVSKKHMMCEAEFQNR